MTTFKWLQKYKRKGTESRNISFQLTNQPDDGKAYECFPLFIYLSLEDYKIDTVGSFQILDHLGIILVVKSY